MRKLAASLALLTLALALPPSPADASPRRGPFRRGPFAQRRGPRHNADAVRLNGRVFRLVPVR